MTSPTKNKTKQKQNKTKQNKTKQNKTNKQTNKNSVLFFILPETIGIFISIDIDYNRRGFIPGSTQT